MKLKSKLGKSKLGFSLVELSVSILVVAVLMFLVIQGGDLISQAKLGIARQKTANSPVAKMNGLILWLETTMPDSFLTSEVTDGGTLTAWNDISGSNPNSPIIFTPIASSPTYVSNSLNGIPSINFSQPLRVLNFDFNNVGSGGFAIFMVLHNKSGGSNLLTLTDYTNSFSIFINSSGYFTTSFPSTGNRSGSTSINGNFNILLSSRDNSSNYTSRANGADYAFSSGVSDSILGHVSDFRIGHAANLYVSEIIIFNTALSDQEIEDVERYLSDKYNITISS